MNIKSTFAILDVKDGRAELADHFANVAPDGLCPREKRIPVMIVGYIDAQWSDDDGESIEFSVVVENLTVVGATNNA